jgi:hypothetical protein
MHGKSMVGLIAAVALAGCAMHGPARPQSEADDGAGAVATNFWYTPGRALICGTSAILAGFVMTVTLGQSYDSASEVLHGACSGPWTVSDQDVRNTVP